MKTHSGCWSFSNEPFGAGYAQALHPSQTHVLKRVESVVLFVHDVVAAAKWYAEIFDVEVQFENPLFAFVRGPGVVVGFHPADEKYPGGIGGTSAYWEVEDLNEAVTFLTERGARLYRGPYRTDFVAAVALMFDPFGCTVGLNQSTEESRRSVLTQFPQAGT